MRRTLLLLPAIALALPGLAGCGEDEADATELIRTASSATSDAGSTQIGYHAVVEGLPSGGAIDSFEMTGEGAFDFESERGSLTLTYPEDLPGIGGQEFESVFEGTTTYLRAELFGPLPGDAEWVRMDVQELMQEEAGIDLSQMPASGSGDPTSTLDMLDGVSDEGVEEVGEEDVEGVSATHYRAEIDLSQAYEQMDAVEDQEQFEAFMAMFGEDDTVTTDVWLDDEGRVVRQRFEQPFPIDGAESDTTMTITMTFSDFGEPVEVDVPDEGATVDVQELLDQLPGN